MLVTPQQASSREYDYVIVGGGTAGLCLAARLSEDPAKSVLVVEAGEANLNDPAILRPASYGSHYDNNAYDWGHKTVPQEFANGTQVPWPRGKGLGGSSAINFMVWTKPPAADIDDIEKLGNPGWNWENFTKYLGRAERFINPSPESQAKHNFRVGNWKTGTDGPLIIAFPNEIVAPELDIQQALINSGLPPAPNPLSGDPSGYFYTANTVDPLTHTRSYSATAFYLPNAERPNLNVLVSAPVQKIITEDGKDGKIVATAVEYLSNGEIGVVRAKKEVILSAGALKTPQLLELSGIGSRAVLEKQQIPVKIDLPSVGENLQEHMFAALSWEVKEGVSFDTLDLLRDSKGSADHLELHKGGQGLYTTGITNVAFAPLDALSPRAEAIYEQVKANFEKNVDSYSPRDIDYFKTQIERLERRAPACEIISYPGFFSAPNSPQSNKKYLSIFMAMNHALSRGNVHITSSSPAVDPAYDPRYFEQETDLLTFIEKIKFARKLADTEPFKSLLVGEVNPGPEVKSDEDIGNWIKNYMFTTYHTCGTASMLPKEKDGVVDTNLKVYGTENLRVVDLSIVPIHFAAHSVSTVYAIAEQAADIIKSA